MEISPTPVPSPPLRAACMLAGCPPGWCVMPAEHLPICKGYMCIYIYLSRPGFVKLLLPMLGVVVLQPVAILCWKVGPWSRGFPAGASLGGLSAPWGHDGGWRAGVPVLAVTLAPCPQETRLKEGIVKLKPHEEPLRSELLSGKFTILVGGGIPPP